MRKEYVRLGVALALASCAFGNAGLTFASDALGTASWSLLSPKDAAGLTATKDHVYQVAVRKPSAKYYETQLTHDIAVAIPAGHSLTFRFVARSSTNNPIHIVIEKRTAPYTHHLDKLTVLTPGWKPYSFTIRLPAAHPAGELAARLQLALQAGTMEFKNVTVDEAAK